MNRLNKLLGLSGAVAALAHGAQSVAEEKVIIHKVDYPEAGLCGQEENVTKSNLNPHWFFPMTFGGFHEGPCSEAGFSRYVHSEKIDMHPLPFVHHTLTFDIYERPIGTITEISLPDPSRSNKKVTAKLCIPQGQQAKQLSLYVSGHGFDCRPDDYVYFCSSGRVVAMVYEASHVALDLNTKSLGQDAAFLASELPRQARDNPKSPLYGKLGGHVVLGGHSMGGGTSVLAFSDPAHKPAVSGMALFAPGLYTIPSATPYLKNVDVPALIVSGADDCGTNALPKQAQPAFDGLNSTKKVLVVLKGANHCQWAQAVEGEVGVCTLDECHGIDGDAQRKFGVQLLDAFMQGLADDKAWKSFEHRLADAEAKGVLTYSYETDAVGVTSLATFA
eukprot:TRINITY_DN20590_c0_g1_i5.p1 TRINITY_DN20590_c0_g1~~TRINITY_DN20590_c0_g1_i5.p1  ORF type:complete len:412 (+),score=90.19 TRINITY_DN20590_c0_g1_i5:72-1238(+)